MCSNVINELSRQLRTFFNLKSAVVRTRFLRTPASILSLEKVITPVSKKGFTEQSIHFVKILNGLPPLDGSFEERLQVLVVQALDTNNLTQRGILMEIKILIKILFQELHIHSEKDPLKDVTFLEQACKMGELLCEVKAILNVQLSEYYSELVKQYTRLSREMTEIRGQKISLDESIKRKEKIGLKVRI
jgi:hypothetical protein